MNSKDVQILTEMKNSLEDPKAEAEVKALAITNPAKELSDSLTSFLTSQFEKVNAQTAYEEKLKSILLARIDEADWSQVADFLTIMQRNDSAQTSALLQAFINQQSGKNVMDSIKDVDPNEGDVGEKVYEGTESKKILQSLDALQRIVSAVKKEEREKHVTDAKAEVIE